MTKTLSTHCQNRLHAFKTLIADLDYDNDRAISGLKSWKFRHSHRLTEHDNNAIDWAIDWAIELNR